MDLQTCKALSTIMFERSVWLQIAESVSQSRPLPYTATQARDLSLRALILSCLRAQRVSKRWAQADVYSRKSPIRISFPDRRIFIYFTFLPGSRHVMLYDMHNILSCWTTGGEFLETMQMAEGAKLVRWKPCDESENIYDYNRQMQAVEITVEHPGRSGPIRCELILLTYSGTVAKLEQVASFQVPNVYEPFSAMTQDELRGALVGIPSFSNSRDKVGIYLTDRNTEKAVCIDTGLPLVYNCSPQALLSSSHVVLYWETLAGAHYVSYDINTLRNVLALEGRDQHDPALSWPVAILPTDERVVPFITVRADNADGVECSHCGAPVDILSTDLSNNRNPYPVITPKWSTLREDLHRHRTRSVLTFSRRTVSHAFDTQNNHNFQAQAAAAHNMLHQQEAALETADAVGLNGTYDGLGVDQGDAAAHGQHNPNLPQYQLVHNQLHLHPQIHVNIIPRAVPPPLPLTTITHHYFDYPGNGSGPSVLKRTIIAEVTLRRGLLLPWPLEGGNVEHVGHAGVNDGDEDLIEGFGMDDLDIEDFGGFADAGEGANHEDGFAFHLNNHQPADPLEFGEAIGALHHGMDGLQLNLGNHGGLPIDFAGGVVELQALGADAAQALADVVQDPVGGNPVMGYGGRCAIWIEERPRQYHANGREPVLRLATFPTYEPPREQYGESRSEVRVHPELEEGRGRVSTLHMPPYIPLENAYTFDLDDVRGVVGIVTSHGDIWLIDYS
ncbi:hypothetical protein EW145_g4768 [Phellinidium pouzarii]|uniref:F-box domain-containing protein n=1 Tax=Phellinidium pouzarii TaxID=167371 RepID=A0A4S4L2A6_9AGAM|nr:hypothetical protein EW145_g4768 [Phellinidium pouzarii]